MQAKLTDVQRDNGNALFTFMVTFQAGFDGPMVVSVSLASLAQLTQAQRRTLVLQTLKDKLAASAAPAPVGISVGDIVDI